MRKTITRENSVPSGFLELGENDTDYVVLVDKSKQQVMLYKSDNPFVPEKVFQCSTGENDGPKSKANDRKTPEGIYFFINSVKEKYLTPIYGARALPIDYPNLVDRNEGRSGYGIWFHGTNKPLKPRDSNGCIVLGNGDIEDLASSVKLFETPVLISSAFSMVSKDTMEKEADYFKRIIEDWRKAWEENKIDRYMSIYHRDFSSGGKNWQQWKDHKTDLAKRYKKIAVKIDDIRLFSSGGTVLATFRQEYRSPMFESHGVKSLYFSKNSNQWKIIGEDFRGKDEAKSPPSKQPVDPFKEISDFICSWKDAWEKKELERYISCYDQEFESRGMDIIEWEKHREKLNKKYRSLKIDISALKIKRISKDSAGVTFHQNYRADDYSDTGIKEMVLIKRKKDWKIREEKWTPIKRKSRR